MQLTMELSGELTMELPGELTMEPPGQVPAIGAPEPSPR